MPAYKNEQNSNITAELTLLWILIYKVSDPNATNKNK